MTMYIGVNGVARKVKGVWVGVNGVARKVTSGYVGVNGVARRFRTEPIIPVTNITNLLTYSIDYLGNVLTGTVVPSNATYKTIVWSLAYDYKGSVTIKGNVVDSNGLSPVAIKATIVNGLDIGKDFVLVYDLDIASG